MSSVWPFGDLRSLKEMASDPACALELGKAAEHIVCADLIMQGLRAYLSDQGLPYDIVIDMNGRLIRVQVKAACYPKNVNASGRAKRIAYTFAVRKRGKNGARNLSNQDCDLLALVGLDIGKVAYFPIEMAAQSIQLSPPGILPETRTWRGGWLRTIDQWPITDALIGPSAYSKVSRRDDPTHCKHGHEYAVTGFYKGKACAECARIGANEYNRRRREERGAA